MRIRTVRHKGLKRFVEDDDDRGIRRDLVNRVRRILTALLSVEDIEGLQGRPAGASPACRRPRQNVEHFSFGQLADYLRNRQR
jgi:plasmid maintenance system killer protein